MNPINLVINVVSNVATEINKIITSASAASSSFSSLTTSISSSLSAAATVFSTLSASISTFVASGSATITPFITSVTTGFRSLFTTAASTFTALSTTVSATFSGISSSVSSTFTSLSSTVSSRIAPAIAPLTSLATSVGTTFTGIATSISRTYSSLSATITGLISRLPRFPSPVPQTVNDEILTLAKALGKSYGEAEKFAQKLGLTGTEAKKAIERIKELKEASVSSGMQFKTLQSDLGITSQQFKKLSAAAGGGEGKKEGFLGFLQQGFEFASKHFLILQKGIELISSVGHEAWDKMIMQNETLQKSILASSTSLVSTARIFSNGLEIKNTTEAIKTLEPAMRKSLDQIAKDSLNIVGVTSSQLTEVFQVLLSNSSSLMNQSKTMADPMKAATKQTTLWAAALGTMGLGMAQARQEISAIYSQQIDVNATVAKNLGITNQMVGAWKAQGTLVDELNKRLQPFYEGNALAAQSIDGISSNLQECVELSTRVAGEPVYKFIVQVLQKFYDWVVTQQAALTDSLTLMATSFVEAGEQMMQALGPAAEDIGNAISDLIPTTGRLFTVIMAGATQAVIILAPVIELLTSIIAKAAEGYEMLTRLIMREKIGDGENFLDEQANQINEISDNVNRLNGQYLALEKKKKSGVKLTDEEIQQQKQLKVGIVAQSERLTQLQSTMKAFVPITEEQRTRMDGLMADVDRNSNILVRTGMSGVTTLGKLVPEIGSAYKQMGDKVDGAITKLEKAEGSTEDFNNNAKTVVDITKQQLQYGYISREEAAKRFKFIASNTRASSENQLAAQKELDAVLKKSADDKVDDIADSEAKIQTLTKAGRLSQAEGDRQLTQEKVKETKQRLTNIAKEITDEENLRKKGIQDQIKELEKSLKSGTLSKEQTEKVKQQLAQLKALEVDGTSDKLDELKKQQKKYQNELTTTEAQGEEQRNKEKLKNFEEQLSIAKSQNDQKLLTEHNFNQKNLDLTNAQANEELKQIADKRKKLAKTDKEGLEALNVEEQKVRAKMFQAKEKFLADELKFKQEHNQRLLQIEQSLLDRQLIGSEEFENKSYALSQKRIQDELASIEQEKKLLPASGKARAEGLEKLAAKEAEIRGKSAKAERDHLQNLLKIKLEHFDRLSAISTAARDRDLISTEEFNSKSIALSRGRINEELKALEKERALIPKSGSGRAEALEKLAAKEAEIRAKAYKQEKDYLENQLKAKLDHFDRLGQIQNSKLSLQLISTQDFNNKSIILDRQRFTEELKSLEKERALIPKSGSGRAEALEKLAAKEAEIRAKAYKQEQEYLANKLKATTEHLDRVGQIQQAKLDLQLSSTTEFNHKSIALERQRAAVELNNIEEQRKLIPKTGSGRIEALEKLVAQEIGIKARLYKAEQANLENQLKVETEHLDRVGQIQQANFDRQLSATTEFNEQSIQLARKRAEAELAAIQGQRQLIPQGAGRAEALEKLAAREAQVRATLFKQEQQFQENQFKATSEHLERIGQLQQANLDQQLVTSEQFAAKSLEIERQRATEELKLIEAQRQQINASGMSQAVRTEALEKLAAREAGVRSRLYKAEQQSLDASLKARTDHYDRLLQLEQAKLDQRQINEVEFAKKSLQLNKARSSEELQAIEVERSRITATGAARIEALEKLAVKEALIKAKIAKQSDELTDKLRQESLYKLETAQKKATDTILQAEVDRQIAEQKLINIGLLKKEDTEKASLQATRNRINAELSAEKQKLIALESLPKYQDPKREEQHQADIRASRKRISELTLDLLKNEEAQQEYLRKATIKKLDDYIAKLNNATEAQIQNYQQYIKGIETANKALDNQLKLKGAEKELQTALDDSIQRNFKILQETAKTDDEKKKLAERAAKANLDARLKQFNIEKDSLELQIKQTEFAQKRLEIENQIAIARNKTEQAKDRVAILKAKTNKATPEELAALELTLQARIEEGSSLKDAGRDLTGSRNLLNFFNEVKRTNLDVQQSTQYQDAQYNWAKSIVNDAEREKQINLIRQDAQQALKLEQTPGGTLLSRQISEAQRLQAANPGYYNYKNNQFNFGNAERYDPEYKAEQKKKAEQMKERGLLIEEDKRQQRADKNLTQKDLQLQKTEQDIQKLESSNAKADAERIAIAKDKSIISPMPGLKINVPGQVASSDLGRVVNEIIKLQTIVGKSSKPNVRQEFNQTNHFTGANAPEQLAKKTDEQWRKGMVKFIDALNRI